jgi:F-type H+-transporting ATPase subunit b
MMSRLHDHLRALLAASVLALMLGVSPVLAQEPAEHGAAPAANGAAPAANEPLLEHDVEEAEHGAGMPQLNAATYASQIFWLIVTFGALYWLLSRKALPRVTEILDTRQTRIASDLDSAASLRTEAEAAEQRHEQVVAEAHARAQQQIKELTERLSADAASRQSALDADLAHKLREAETRVRTARESALADVRGVAVEAAQAAVERLAGMRVARETVEAALDRVQREAA